MNIVKQDIWQYLKTDKKPIVLYGMGNGADKIIKALERISVKPSGVFATDGFVRDKRFHGMSLTTYSALKERFGDTINTRITIWPTLVTARWTSTKV